MYSFSAINNEKIMTYDFVPQNELFITYKKYISLTREEREKFKNIVIQISLGDAESAAMPIFASLSDRKICISGNALQTKMFVEDYFDELTLNNISYFSYDIVDTWDKFHSLIRLGVSDVFIGNELAFSYEKLLTQARKNNIKLRIYPNVAQNGDLEYGLSAIKSFFIRPEDIGLYENDDTIICFFGPEDRQRVLYDIYSKHRWLGDLKDLIIGFDTSIDNTRIPPMFGTTRFNCGKACSYDKCLTCEKIEVFANELEKTPIAFNYPKIKEEIDELRRDKALMQFESRRNKNTSDEILNQE